MQELHGQLVAKHCHSCRSLEDRWRNKSSCNATIAVDTVAPSWNVGVRFREGEFVEVWSKTVGGWWLALVTQCEDDSANPGSDARLEVEYDIPAVGYCRKKLLSSSKCLRAPSDPKQHKLPKHRIGKQRMQHVDPESSSSSELEECDPKWNFWGSKAFRPSADADGYPVYVNIYHVGDASILKVINSVLAPSTLPVKMCGVFHAGVEVFGREFGFGGGAGFPDESGVYECKPREDKCHSFRQALRMRNTMYGVAEINSIVAKLKKGYTLDRYHLLTCNCCHFADVLCIALDVGRLPRWVNRLARLAALSPTLRVALDVQVQRE